MIATILADDLPRPWVGGAVAGLSEAQLVERFVGGRDEGAFRAIIERHGAMVLGVCRAILANPADADDAFQATFLVLVRRRESLRDGDRLGPWLHGVARRVALEARRSAAARRESAGARVEPARADPGLLDPERREVREIVHREIDRLDQGERSAVTLCLLEGLTHQEAADQLGWPLGTVKTRVARGRDRLRDRLLRRDPTLTAPAFGAILLGESAAHLAVRPALAAATARGAVALLSGRLAAASLVSVAVLNLAQGVTRTMIFAPWKVGALTLLAATATVAAGIVAAPLVAQQPAGPEAARPPRAAVPAPPKADAPGTPAATGGGLGDFGGFGNPPAFDEDAGSATAVPVESQPGDPEPRPAYMQTRIAQEAVGTIQGRDRDGKPIAEPVRFLWYRRLAEAQFAEAPDHQAQLAAVVAYIRLLREYARQQASQANLDFDPPKGDLRRERANDFTWMRAATVDAEIAAAARWYSAVKGGDPKKRPNSPQMKAPDRDPTSDAFRRIKPLPADQQQNQIIKEKLEERISMNFPNDTPLSDILQYIAKSTQDEAAGLPSGIPIYVDRNSLQDADRTEASPIAISLEGIPLRTTLELLLDQLNLGFVVEGGVLIVMNRDEIGPNEHQPIIKEQAGGPGGPADAKAGGAGKATTKPAKPPIGERFR